MRTVDPRLESVETQDQRAYSLAQLLTLPPLSSRSQRSGSSLPADAWGLMELTTSRPHRFSLFQSLEFAWEDRRTPPLAVAPKSSRASLEVYIDRHWLRHGFLRQDGALGSHASRNEAFAQHRILDFARLAYLDFDERATNDIDQRPVSANRDDERLAAIEKLLAEGITVTGAQGIAVEVETLDQRGTKDGQALPRAVHPTASATATGEVSSDTQRETNPDPRPAT